MKRKPLSFLALGGCLVAGGAQATTYGPEPSMEAALRHAQTVLVGYFTGESEIEKRVLKGVMNDEGEVFDDVVLYTAYQLEVTDVLAGEKPPERVRINVPGAVELPEPKQRIVVGLSPDEGSPAGGYTLVYGKFLPAQSDAELDQARKLVEKARVGLAVDPQAILDRLGEAEAARDGGRQLRHPPEPVRPEGDDPLPERQREFRTDLGKKAAEPVAPSGEDLPGQDEDGRGADAYWRVLAEAVADLEIADEESEALATERDRQGLEGGALRTLHARAVQLALGWAIEDGELDEAEAKRLSELHSALARLGWAPGR